MEGRSGRGDALWRQGHDRAGLPRVADRHQYLPHHRRAERCGMCQPRRTGRSQRPCRRVDEGSSIDRQVHARHSQQGCGPLPAQGCVEPCGRDRDAGPRAPALGIGRSRDSAARLQAEDHPHRLSGQDGQAAGHRLPEDHLPKEPFWPRWATADSWEMSSSTVPCRST